ncbi:MAG: hypothetical protein ACJ8AW_54655 [Rhodopila sp.]
MPVIVDASRYFIDIMKGRAQAAVTLTEGAKFLAKKQFSAAPLFAHKARRKQIGRERSQYNLLCVLCAPLCALCVKNAMPQQRMALAMTRTTSNTGGASTTATQHRARRAERRGRRDGIIATCGRGGLGLIGVALVRPGQDNRWSGATK